MKHIIQVRRNYRYIVGNEKPDLFPELELILIVQEPCYESDEKWDVTKKFRTEEIRLAMQPVELENFIGQLQRIYDEFEPFMDLSDAVNRAMAKNDEDPKPSEEPKSPEEPPAP